MVHDTRSGPVRVVHVTPGLDMGGQEKLLIEFARHADPKWFDLRFLCLGTRGSLAADVEAYGWPVHHLDAPAGWRPDLIVRLAWLFRRWGADVVHTHEDRPLVHGALAAALARVKTIIHSRHGQSLGMSRRQTWLVNLAARCTDHFVCVSRDGARLAVAHGVSAGKVKTIWNGIDLARFSCVGPNPTGPVVCVSRLSPEKGIDSLMRTAALVVARNPRFRLEIAGDGMCMPALRQLVSQLGLGNHVHLLGEVADISALLARARLFVLPSLTEGISLTILEAMARGLPVVATRVGGTVEVVVEGQTGLLAAPNNPAELADTLLQLHDKPEQARALGQAGRRRVEQYFNVRQMVARYEDLYVGPFSRLAVPAACEARTEVRELAQGLQIDSASANRPCSP